MNNIRMFINDAEVPLEIGKFPGGEVKVRILAPMKASTPHIHAFLRSSDDVMALIMLVDAIKRTGSMSNSRLTMPYIPYARQDRQCNTGESFSLAAFAGIINSLKFASVVVYDPHSKVAVDQIERCIAVPSSELIRKHTETNDWILRTIWSGVPLYLVCPDEGAIARTQEIADHFSVKGIIYAKKIRNPENGQIVATEVADVPADIDESKLLIVDDICDGGRTFIELAKVLVKYEPKEMNLYVTHGIFSQGKNVLAKNMSDHSLDPTNVTNSGGPFDNVWSTIDFTAK